MQSERIIPKLESCTVRPCNLNWSLEKDLSQYLSVYSNARAKIDSIADELVESNQDRVLGVLENVLDLGPREEEVVPGRQSASGGGMRRRRRRRRRRNTVNRRILGAKAVARFLSIFFKATTQRDVAGAGWVLHVGKPGGLVFLKAINCAFIPSIIPFFLIRPWCID